MTIGNDKERLFIIVHKTKEKTYIKGYVKSRYYPSDIANDPEKALEKFGCRHPKIIEIRETCCVSIELSE